MMQIYLKILQLIRNNGLFGKGKWSILGYSFENERQIIDDDSADIKIRKSK